MKRMLLSLLLAGTAGFLGCSKSSDPVPPTAPEAPQPVEPPSTPEAKAPPSTPTPDATSALTEQANAVVKEAKVAATGLKDQFMASLPSSSDATLNEIGQEIATRLGATTESFQGEQGLQDQLTGAVESLLGGQDAEAVGLFGKLGEAKLTPEQKTVYDDLKNSVSAFVVQRNFSSLSDSTTEVGKIVTALRGGDTATALVQLKEVSSKANLTPQQSELLSGLVDQYTPGLKDAGKAAAEGIKSLNPF